MAIVFEPQRKPVNWIMILSIVFSVTFLVVGGYYLFFSAVPKIDQVLPTPLERASQISNVGDFTDPNTVLGNRPFTDLRSFAAPISVGVLGRSNPFAPF